MKNSLRFILLSIVLLTAWTAQAIPRIQSWHTKNGAKVMFIPSESVPMLDVRVVFDAGSARDHGNSGLAVLTNGLLSEGAAGMNAQQIAEAFESVGAEFNNDALHDMALVSVRTLVESKYLKPALAAFHKVLTQPDFPVKAFEREKNQMKVSVQASEQSPDDIASKAFYKAVYGDHPYGSPVSGSIKSLNKITLSDVRAFYKKYYVARNATIAIVGKINRQQAEAIANALISALPAGEKAPLLPGVKPVIQSKTIKIEYPSEQTHIYMGQVGVKRGDKDYYALYLGNYSLGGSGFSSRLVHVIREKNALAYSVYSYFLPMRQAGLFMMGMQTRTNKAMHALSLLKQTLHNYLKEGPTAAELKAAKDNITGGFPLNLDSNSKLLGYISMIGFYNLPLDYLDHFVENINAITLPEVKSALHRRLNDSKMVTVIVGKLKK